MRFPWLACFALLACAVVKSTAAESPSRLVVVGGGRIPDKVRSKFIELGGGTQSRLLIIPQASNQPTAGEEAAKVFREIGVKEIEVLDLKEPDKAREQIRRAGAVWIGGGQQKDLMDRLEAAGVVEDLQRRHRAGVTFGGTSAGAAVMSEVMIAGDTLPLDRGLALWPEVIVDQHFVARNRFNRSLRTVLDHPKLLGVGIDEATAVIVSAGQFEVIGESSVTVIDARQATSKGTSKGLEASVRDVRVHLLRKGETFHFNESKP